MRHLLFDVPIDDLSNENLDAQLTEWMNGTVQKFITTPNPEFLLLARKDEEFQKILQSSDLSLPDGVGLRFAIAALTNETLSYRHTGVDLVERVAYLSNENHKHVLLVGGDPGSAEKTKEVFEKQYPGIKISIFNPGQVTFPISDRILETLLEISPDIMLVALGQKKQEKFIHEVLPNVPSIRIAVGIGGAFEMIAGMKPRAPRIMSQMGLEWVWRVFIEPKRIGRILNASFVFPIMVVYGTLRQHRLWRACKHVLPEIYRQLTGL
ncbi:MAG: WecB/TagA/CpsF family glycosyltransferase [Candidatus Uhrbacteria bacterium]|nr:WecB/TagA/CpsF family glycosyltransferase [Candidatus Uhrbacteria bacterium]